MSEWSYMIANGSVLPVWILMIFAPSFPFTERLTRSLWVPALYAMAYCGLLIGSVVAGGEGDMFSLEGLRLSFDRDLVLLLAWVHYLCFDMIVGMWVFRDAKRLALPWWGVIPCLICTLLIGPVGFLAYATYRRVFSGVSSWDSGNR